MATVKTDVYEVPLDSEELEAEDKIKQIFEDVGEDITSVKCKLYRILHGEYEWLYDATPPEMPGVHDRLRDEYGPGIYETRIFMNGRMKKRLKIKIGGKLADKFPQQKDDGMKPDQVLSMIAEMQKTQMSQFQLMMEQQQNAIAQTVTASAPTPQQTVDPMAMQANMMAMMAQMKDFVTPAHQPVSQDPIEFMTKMMDLQNTMGALSGEGGTGALLASVAKDVLPQLVDLAKIDGLKKPNASLPPVPPPAPPPVQKPNPTPQLNLKPAISPEITPDTPQENDQMLEKIFIKRTVAMLLPKARTDRDPITYAEVLLDAASEYNQEEFAVSFIVSPEFCDRLIAIDPQVAQYRPWFEQLREAVIEMIGEVPDSGPVNADTDDKKPVIEPPGRRVRDTGDAQNNEPVSEGLQDQRPDP
jgi:hypothetical protein